MSNRWTSFIANIISGTIFAVVAHYALNGTGAETFISFWIGFYGKVD